MKKIANMIVKVGSKNLTGLTVEEVEKRLEGKLRKASEWDKNEIKNYVLSNKGDYDEYYVIDDGEYGEMGQYGYYGFIFGEKNGELIQLL